MRCQNLVRKTSWSRCTPLRRIQPIVRVTIYIFAFWDSDRSHALGKTVKAYQVPGNIVGSDFAGIVVEIGSDIVPGTRKIGERVAGLVFGGRSTKVSDFNVITLPLTALVPNGAFAEYVVAPGEVVFSLPDDISFEDAAQLGGACYTACQTLYQVLRLPTPLEPPLTPQETILIWSGATATGQIAIQFAKLSGLRVVTTASGKSAQLVKSLGADEVFDYADPETPQKIRDATSSGIKYAMDCISEGLAPSQVAASLSPEGATIAALLPHSQTFEGVNIKFVLVGTLFGKVSFLLKHGHAIILIVV